VSPIDHDCTPQERNVLLDRIAALEAHTADCKRLVTACEDDIDMLRLRCREREAERDRARYGLDRQTKRADKAEAEVARLRKLFGMAERGTK